MVVKNITIKNFKSFGNNSQTIELENKGNLILLSGRNGSGKSSIIDSFDYVFFKEVAAKSKNKKKLKLSSISNRINKNMEVTTNIIANDGTDVKIVRGQDPSVLELWENGVENKRAGKDKINKMIVDYIGMDLATFKGFISMSINDFKNFISLSNEEKKLLLDKLFNLEVINTLNKILNNLIRDNDDELDILNKEIEIISEHLDNINLSIDNVKNKKEENHKIKVQNLKNKIKSSIKTHNIIEEKLKLVKEKKKEIEKNISDEKIKLSEINSDLKKLEEQLKLLDNDQCPVCESDLNNDFHKGLKESYLERKEKSIQLKKEIISHGNKLTKSLKKINLLNKKGDEKLLESSSTMKSLKNDLSNLNKEDDTLDLKEFYNQIDSLNKKKKNVEINQNTSKDKQIYHKSIKTILSENGVKKTIIKSIVAPINKYIEENLKKMHLPFEVVLDDTFSSKISILGEEIDVETLSTGESKKVNIAILLAYLKLIRTKKQVNVLFLDEVFSSVDVESIDDVIGLLRDLADNSKINIFLVHHSVLDSQHFDRIIKVEKDVFSYIEEEKIKY